jgi:hypothetical protein
VLRNQRAFVGRKRKDGPRTASGQLSRARSARGPISEARSLALLQRARFGATRSNASDPRWATPWGRLHLREQISKSEFEAAEAYHHLLARARRIQSMPKPWVQGPAWLIGKAGRASSADSELDERDRLVLERRNEVEAELRAMGGRVEAVLDWVIRQQKDPALHDLPALRAGLRSLGRLLGIDSSSGAV